MHLCVKFESFNVTSRDTTTLKETDRFVSVEDLKLDKCFTYWKQYIRQKFMENMVCFVMQTIFSDMNKMYFSE